MLGGAVHSLLAFLIKKSSYAVVNVSQVLEADTTTLCTEHLSAARLTQLTQELLWDIFFIIIIFYTNLINIET